MRLPLCLLVFCAAASGQVHPADASSRADAITASALPAVPPGRSSVLGGSINKVDLVRDSLELKIAGGHAVKVLFDERTKVFENGKPMSVLDLRASDHASIETRLDGSAIFAMRVHILSDVPEGKFRGQVTAYNPATGELKLQVADGRDPVVLAVPTGTPISNMGHDSVAKQDVNSVDLTRGALVDVTFKASKGGKGSATRVDILAVPGTEFVFRGNLSALDMRAGRMSIASAAEMEPRDVVFEASRFPSSKELRVGTPVEVKTRFDGSHYVATAIVAQ